ncbi:probable serine/threonine-protein kinase SIS8 isoform X3 [Manihot esculenta]|uniref:probable serine/threonine-protein kinase SIS8 isoform X3 n=1 Tax=Manihot esculenta TaxID=3983 RepID=UPI000B5D7F33|nr:probable serine/threonine-protein kinase SIS8 isoform X3 [Manihot esculenta]
MKNFFKKLHITSNQSHDAAEGSNSSKGTNKPINPSSPDRILPSRSHEHNPFSARRESGSTTSRDPEIEEEYHIQLALELSAREDPEAVQIEAVKQISLGTCAPENTPAEVVAYRYWNYNALNYDDKIMDGFYDLYGIFMESTSERMPSLVDLQGTPVSDNVSWEAVLVNRVADANLLKLEQKALEMAVKLRSESPISTDRDFVQKLAVLVSDYMGGSVGDPDNITRAWRSLSYSLKATLGSMVLPLGSLTIGLARHRALMFKVLVDSVGVPCRLVKGHQYTGSDDVAMNFVKIDDGREYIVDLMAAPGTLIPSDVAGSHIVYDESFFSSSHLSQAIDSSHRASSSSGVASSFEEHSDVGTLEKKSRLRNVAGSRNQSDERCEFHEFANMTRTIKGEEESKMILDDFKKCSNVEKGPGRESPVRPSYPFTHGRSPSWTEGVSSPAAHRLKVKDVSQYMIDAAKENPQLAQKLHDVLLESGVVAPPSLFTEIYHEQLDGSTNEAKSPAEDKDDYKQISEARHMKDQDDLGPAQFLPPLPHQRLHYKASPVSNQPEQLKPVEDLRLNHPFETIDVTRQPVSLQSEATSASCAKNVPVAAAAAAAAVVASSMVVAVAKSSTDSNLPVAAAAAAAATTAAVSKQYEQCTRSDGDAKSSGYESRGSKDHGNGGQERGTPGENSEGQRMSDRSAGNDSLKSDAGLDDIAECDIPWEEITLGERIGLGSYGEVYRGDWHGTEVAVKRFLDQGISGESLEEFRSEVRIMKRLRHPNVVLFMGAVTHAPNLSIVTEFLPRGSLYRLIHRPNNQLDERRRLRMALDTARGMNYLHNCTPMIVHRDLKSPNLLVDKNWVVKVSDFGLSRMKHNTFLSSRSAAGTAEWMAPEVLRNEPSDEKCDVYSFGVILWELCTLQQPWGGMNPMQVVGAVGFQQRRLEIPDGMDPVIADVIRKCWQTDPKLRPTFAEIMAALKPLQKPITGAQVPRRSSSTRGGHEKGQVSREEEEQAG